jgi:hypothetical protein
MDRAHFDAFSTLVAFAGIKNRFVRDNAECISIADTGTLPASRTARFIHRKIGAVIR